MLVILEREKENLNYKKRGTILLHKKVLKQLEMWPLRSVLIIAMDHSIELKFWTRRCNDNQKSYFFCFLKSIWRDAYY